MNLEIWSVYLIVLVYFAAGAGLTAFNCRKRAATKKDESWLVFSVFFVVVSAGFLLLWDAPGLFRVAMTIMALRGAFELYALRSNARRMGRSGFAASAALYGVIAALFLIHLWRAPTSVLMFVFFIAVVFDGFSQVTGQLFGGPKLTPWISPNKTVAGLCGGLLVTCATAEYVAPHTLSLSLPLCAAALLGDLSASLYKRLNGAKDYPAFFPGHGGVLDRFDSYLACGAAAAMFFNYAA